MAEPIEIIQADYDSKLTSDIINKYYADIVMRNPSYLEVGNTYERYCVYRALEKYAENWNSIWFNKSYKKEPKYASENICKYCYRKNRKQNIVEHEVEDVEDRTSQEYFWCKNCCDMYKTRYHGEIWEEGDFMYLRKVAYRINIYYTQPKIKTRSFLHNSNQP